VAQAHAPDERKEFTMKTTADLALRFETNPLVKPTDLRPIRSGWKVECLLNPGVFRFQGRTGLVVRVAERPPQRDGFVTIATLADTGEAYTTDFPRNDPDLDLSDPRVLRFDGDDYLTTLSHLRLLWSNDGIHFREDPAYPPLSGEGPYETFGIEDARVSRIGEEYFLTYTAVSPNGVAVGMRSTRDWKAFKKHGLIFAPHNKDCALWEEKIGQSWFALHRPSSPDLGGNFIWLAQSPDLTHWGNHHCLIRTRPGMWDSVRVGAGASPIKTAKGWLVIYHGADERSRYCLGALLVDLHDPRQIVTRSQDPIMEPLEVYETEGFFGNVVFTNGHFVDGDEITLFYGAADSVICAARLSIEAILRSLD
jgi:beta-1,2-mannobiose phosphorylase / 1,2-beta-oligomannan phosphorylase